MEEQVVPGRGNAHKVLVLKWFDSNHTDDGV